jgi:hypothetical protein
MHVWPVVHMWPHAPQFARSAPRFASQPFEAAMSQSPKPPLHVPTEHALAAHAAVALATEHGVHDPAPQPYIGSVALTHAPPQLTCPDGQPAMVSLATSAAPSGAK